MPDGQCHLNKGFVIMSLDLVSLDSPLMNSLGNIFTSKYNNSLGKSSGNWYFLFEKKGWILGLLLLLFSSFFSAFSSFKFSSSLSSFFSFSSFSSLTIISLFSLISILSSPLFFSSSLFSFFSIILFSSPIQQ